MPTDIEFIRSLIDLIDSKKSKQSAEQPEIKDTDIHITVGDRHDPRDIESPLDGDEIFIPPLQQRIEMLKKLSGIEPDNKDLAVHLDSDDPTAS